jgi:hypothetical protein
MPANAIAEQAPSRKVLNVISSSQKMSVSIRFAHGQLLINRESLSIGNRCCDAEQLIYVIDLK